MDEPCDPATLLCNVGGALDVLTGAVGFWQDPWGNTFKTLQDAARGLAQDLLPALTEAATPDISADWFLRAYAISFAAGIIAAMFLLIPQFVRVARGRMAGRELLETLALRLPGFLAGAMFGPVAGQLVIRAAHSLSVSLIAWGIEGSYDSITDRLVALIDTTNPAAMTGGAFVAVVLMFCMVIGLFFVALVFIAQTVTLYFIGVLIPLFAAWMTDPNTQRHAWTGLKIWGAVLLAHPLLFFLLGFAFQMIGGLMLNLGAEDSPLHALVSFLIALIALFVATCSPLLLTRFVPLPTGTGSAPPGITGGTIGAGSVTDAITRFGDRSSDSAPSPRPTDDRGAADSYEREAEIAAIRATSATRDSGGTNSGGGWGEMAQLQARLDAGPAGLETAAATDSAAGAAAGAEGLATAGAAESATGAGAAIGVPTLIAAAGVAAAGKAMEAGDAAAQQAVAPADEEGLS